MSGRDAGHRVLSEFENVFELSKFENMVVSRDSCTVDHPFDECPFRRGAAGGSLKLCRYRRVVA